MRLDVTLDEEQLRGRHESAFRPFPVVRQTGASAQAAAHFETAAYARYCPSGCRTAGGLRESFLPSWSPLSFSPAVEPTATCSPDNGDDWSARFAQRWNPAVWGPGETLEWVIAAEPGWTSPWVEEGTGGTGAVRDPEEALPIIAEGLAAWSNIETADIRWEVTGAENVEGYVRDGRNTVVVRVTPGILGAGKPWARRVNGEWMVEECDVLMSPLVVEDMLAGDIFHLGSLVHEFGHCLNLQHSAAYGDMARFSDVFPDSRGHPPADGLCLCDRFPNLRSMTRSARPWCVPPRAG